MQTGMQVASSAQAAQGPSPLTCSKPGRPYMSSAKPSSTTEVSNRESQSNPFFTSAQYKLARDDIGDFVSFKINSKGAGSNLYMSPEDAYEELKAYGPIKEFMDVEDQDGKAFQAFWSY